MRKGLRAWANVPDDIQSLIKLIGGILTILAFVSTFVSTIVERYTTGTIRTTVVDQRLQSIEIHESKVDAALIDRQKIDDDRHSEVMQHLANVEQGMTDLYRK